MNELIAISTGHREQITPDNTEYSIFFDLLRLFDWRTQPVSNELTGQVLSSYKNLIIGEPHSKFTSTEIKSIREWIKEGGNLLVTGNMGGDTAPFGDRSAKSNIGELLQFITLSDDSIGFDRGVSRGEPFDTSLSVSISQLAGISSYFSYHNGCTLNLIESGEINIRYRIKSPGDAKTVSGVRFSGGSVLASAPYPKPASGYLFLNYGWGKGNVSVLGASLTFDDNTIISKSNTLFTNWLIHTTFNSLFQNHIDKYSELPQRHRLLHGYPYPNLMSKLGNKQELAELVRDVKITQEAENKPVIIGILPHTHCNPQVQGCGFCTFPHENYQKSNIEKTVNMVLEEIDRFDKKYPFFNKTKVKALYFGGGTANLTPLDLFDSLCKKISEKFDCTGTEVTLEGVPVYFGKDNFRFLDILKENFDNSKIRLSIGVQTFDSELLAKMGRQHFGDLKCLETLVKVSNEKGIGLSGDLLFNLPRQTFEQMQSDVETMINLGFNQISIYHLVMFRALGPEWSKDSEILNLLPNNSEAVSNWLKLRDFLLSKGYAQRTLTNFQRNTENNFEYEECVFKPEEYNWLGFGPAAISTFYDREFDRALKLTNYESSELYNAGHAFWEKYYTYDKQDMKILFITRKIALLSINKQLYRKLFSSNIETDFAEEINSLSEKGYIENLNDEIKLTPVGAFYADTVASTFAMRRLVYMKMLNRVRGKVSHADKYFYSQGYTEYRERQNEAACYRMG